jgi:hypothetical protein
MPLIDVPAVLGIGDAAAVAFLFVRERRPGARSAAFVFNATSTVLLFVPINERVPLYVSEVPTCVRLCQ